MRLFSLQKDLSLLTPRAVQAYSAAPNAQAVGVDRLYVEASTEIHQLFTQLQQAHLRNQPDTPVPDTLAGLGLQVHTENAALAWPHFPARLGRLSTRCTGDGLHEHGEAECLPTQLSALRGRKPDKHHFRFVVLNGFGFNLGDCTVGITAFRQVLKCMAQHLPSFSCDIQFGTGVNPATGDLIGDAPEIDQVLYHSPTVAELAHYDGYFDFSGLIALPQYDKMPMVDWYLWWSGLDPQVVPAHHKRNQGSLRWDAWNTVQGLLQNTAPGLQRVLFNPRASVPLRSMPEGVASQFALRLLEQDSRLQLVVDQPVALQHERLIDLSGQIDSPEKFKALLAHVQGLITVDTFALHWGDVCDLPSVTLCTSTRPTAYPYYPYNSCVGLADLEQLPAYGRVKVTESEWTQMVAAYQAAWERTDPVAVLKQLQTQMANRRAAPAAAPGLRMVTERPTRSPITNEPASTAPTSLALPRLRRMQWTPTSQRIQARFGQIAQSLLKPGHRCVMAGAPDAGLALTLARQLGAHGELLVLEPRRLLARCVDSALLDAGLTQVRVEDCLPVAGPGPVPLAVLDPWSESDAGEWGNSRQRTEVPAQSLDAMALPSCHVLLIQSPMDMVQVLEGASETLLRCAPFLLMAPLRLEDAKKLRTLGMFDGYELWSEPLRSGQQSSPVLVFGVPKTKAITVQGFSKIKE